MNGMRLPNKVLMNFQGIPMVEHVRRRAELNSQRAEVYIISGDNEVLMTAQKFQGKYVRSLGIHENGTSRCAEAASQLEHDHFIIAQGDEILLLPRHLNLLIETLQKNPNFEMVNTVAPLKNEEELYDESIVKCLVSKDMKIIMMFRRAPLSLKNQANFQLFYKVLGLFSFSKNLLTKVSTFESTNFERIESIEQMRLMENGVDIQALIVDKSYPSINVERDINEVSKVMENDSEQTDILKLIINEKI